jgi:Outer membrane protein beta-barrel domain
MFCRVRVATGALMAVMVAAPAGAQSIQAGAKFGLNVTSVSNTSVITGLPDDAAGVEPGPLIGAFVTLGPTGGRLAFQSELLLAKKGARLDENSNSRTRLDLWYLEFPLLAKLSLSTGGGRSIYALAGPTFGVKLSASIRSIDSDTDEDTEQNIDDRVKGSDGGLIFGIGIQGDRWVFEGRFTQGLANIAADDSGEAVKIRAFAAVVGVRF